MKSYLTVIACIIIVALSSACSAVAKEYELQIEHDEGNPTLCWEESCIVKPIKITASSTLENKPIYAASNLLLKKGNKVWCEGAQGHGIGEWIRVEFRKSSNIAGFWITPFYAKSRAVMFNNNRIKRMRVEWEGASYEMRFEDSRPEDTFTGGQMAYPSPYVDFQNNKLKGPIKTSWMKFTILDVYPGNKYDDTCISEISFSSKHENH